MLEVASSSQQHTQKSAAISSLLPEFQLLLACSHAGNVQKRSDLIREQLQRPLNWAKTLELAQHHGVVPLLHRGLSEAEEQSDRVPCVIRDELRLGFQRITKKNLWLTAELFRILDCLDSAGITAIPHKGPVLAESAYGDVALRDFWDIDILIRRGDVPRVKEELARIGYIPGFVLSPSEERAYLLSGYEYPFYGPAKKNLLEIQWSLAPRFYAVDLDIEQFFARAVTVSVAGRIVRTLCDEDMLLALSVHAAKHLWMRLCWLRDIAGLTEKSPLDWERMLVETDRLGIRRMFMVGLGLAHRLLGARLQVDFADRWNPDTEIWPICEKIAMQIPNGGSYHTESLNYFLWMMRLRERVLDRARFLGRLAFTPGIEEWSVVKLPARLFPLYHVIRGFRIAGRIIGLRDVSKHI